MCRVRWGESGHNEHVGSHWISEFVKMFPGPLYDSPKLFQKSKKLYTRVEKIYILRRKAGNMFYSINASCWSLLAAYA